MYLNFNYIIILIILIITPWECLSIQKYDFQLPRKHVFAFNPFKIFAKTPSKVAKANVKHISNIRVPGRNRDAMGKIVSTSNDIANEAMSGTSYDSYPNYEVLDQREQWELEQQVIIDEQARLEAEESHRKLTLWGKIFTIIVCVLAFGGILVIAGCAIATCKGSSPAPKPSEGPKKECECNNTTPGSGQLTTTTVTDRVSNMNNKSSYLLPLNHTMPKTTTKLIVNPTYSMLNATTTISNPPNIGSNRRFKVK